MAKLRMVAATGIILLMSGVLAGQFHIIPRAPKKPATATADPAEPATPASPPAPATPDTPPAPDNPPAPPATPAAPIAPIPPVSAPPPAAAPAIQPAPARAASPASEPDFDFYVLTLSWAPNFCASPGAPEANPRECAPGRHIGFTVHGLWPEAAAGRNPESCGDSKPVSKAVVNMILPYMPSPVLIQQEWTVHGSCTGLSPTEYFLGAREARAAIQVPVQLSSLAEPATESPSQIESQFQGANAAFPKNAFRVSCRGGELREVRACFDTGFRPMACPSQPSDCGSHGILVRPPR